MIVGAIYKLRGSTMNNILENIMVWFSVMVITTLIGNYIIGLAQ